MINHKKIIIILFLLCGTHHIQAISLSLLLKHLLTTALQPIKRHPFITAACGTCALATYMWMYKRLTDRKHPTKPATKIRHSFVLNGLITHERDFKIADQPQERKYNQLIMSTHSDLKAPKEVKQTEVIPDSIRAYIPHYFSPHEAKHESLGNIVIACLMEHKEIDGQFARTIQQFASYVARGYGKSVHVVFFSWNGSTESTKFSSNVAQFMADNIKNMGGMRPQIWTITQGNGSSVLDQFAQQLAHDQRYIHTAVHFSNTLPTDHAPTNISRLYHLHDQKEAYSYAPSFKDQEVHNIFITLQNWEQQEHTLQNNISPENLVSLVFDIDSHYKKQIALNAYCSRTVNKDPSSFPLTTLQDIPDEIDEYTFAYHHMRRTQALEKYGARIVK